jgi:hypothetical protein
VKVKSKSKSKCVWCVSDSVARACAYVLTEDTLTGEARQVTGPSLLFTVGVALLRPVSALPLRLTIKP